VDGLLHTVLQDVLSSNDQEQDCVIRVEAHPSLLPSIFKEWAGCVDPKQHMAAAQHVPQIEVAIECDVAP
jgi:hypothetical protein